MVSETRLVVEAGEHDRRLCPASVCVAWDYDTPCATLKDAETGRTVPCQLSRCGTGLALTFVVDSLPAGRSKTYLATPIELPEECSARSGVQVTDRVDAGRVDVMVNGSLFTAYHYGAQWVRPFLHPVIGPGGTPVTRAWPIVEDAPGETHDHPHHKSIWVAYGDCDGVDNWSEEEGCGRQVHREFIHLESGPVRGRICARIDWCNNALRKQFEEIRDIKTYCLPGGVRLLDVSVSLHMTQRAVTFRDTKEGGLLSVRVATSMDASNGGRIQNGYGGINEEETWGKSAPWCDYSGVVEGKQVGIAVFDHEENPRYPTGWHVRNYGLMTANCFAWSYYRPHVGERGDMRFAKGSTTTWRYRVYIHKGDARTGGVAARFLDFAAPPKVHAYDGPED